MKNKRIEKAVRLFILLGAVHSILTGRPVEGAMFLGVLVVTKD